VCAKRARRARDEALQTNTPPSLSDTKADADRGIRAARLQAIKSDILDNLGETSIAVARVAARHRMTPKYVNNLLKPKE
jgi:hypothetical protein